MPKGTASLFTGLDNENTVCYIQNIVIKQRFEYVCKEGDRMAKQKPGVYDRVLECAKEEFLSKGFLDASLRAIAQEAGTSTCSIYTRFGDKEGLFRAIVEPVVDQVQGHVPEIQEASTSWTTRLKKAEMGRYTARHQLDLLDYIYNHFDVFRLLLDRRTRHPICLFPGRVCGH